MRRQKLFRIVVMLVVMLLVIGCDQATKAAARAALGHGGVVSVLGGALILRYVENPGAFLSLGAWLPGAARRWLFVAFPLAVLAAMAVYVARRRALRARFAVGIALVAGGGLGNLLDRILHDGRVGDFLNLGLGGLRTGIFNLADLSILSGCVLLLLGDRPTEHPDRESGKAPPAEG
ncbi:MAG TPA: signal peptidase II [Spirochaetia bacterium]|nr:signal peptidase II [Spirochaetia bacterium]